MPDDVLMEIVSPNGKMVLIKNLDRLALYGFDYDLECQAVCAFMKQCTA